MVVVKVFGVKDLYHSAELEAVGILYHPFTKARMNGTLPPANLCNFLCDEAVLLSAASVLANSREYQLVDKMLVSLSHAEGGRPSSQAEAMRKFMLDKSVQRTDGEAVAVLLAFLHVRVALERQFGSFMPQHEHWIPSSCELLEFQNCVSRVEQDLEWHLRESSNANDLQMVFKETLRHQLKVLDAAYSGDGLQEDKQSPWHPANILFTTDYDITCTVRDTSEVLVSIAQQNSGRTHLEADYWSLMKLHDNRIKACLSLWEHDSVSRKLTSQEDKQSSAFSKLDVELQPMLDELLQDVQDLSGYKNKDLRRVLKQLGELEKRINKEVMAAGVLRGVRREQIRQQVKDIPLHNRCAEVLLRLSEMNTPVHYISATWSRDLVLGGVPQLPKGMLFIHSNDLQYDENGVSDGTFQAVVQDAFDKEAILQALEAVYAGRRKGMTVFLGDSTNDLLALLNADLGIVVGQNPAFREMLSRFKLQVLPLAVAAAKIAACAGGKPTTFRHSGILFETSGWAEVEACLLFSNRNRVFSFKRE